MKKEDLFTNQKITYVGNNDTVIEARFQSLHPEMEGLAWVLRTDGSKDVAEIETMQSLEKVPGIKADTDKLYEGKPVLYENNGGYQSAVFKRVYGAQGLCWVEVSPGVEDVAEIERLREEKVSPKNKM